MLIRTIILFIFALLTFSNSANAQTIDKKGKILKQGVIIDGDTLPHTYLRKVIIYDPALVGLTHRQKRRHRRRLVRRRRKYDKLKRNVYKTYPYAVMTSFVIHDIDSAMLTIRSKESKNLYKRRKEKELMKKYKGKLTNLTMSQGKTLVILIARQTGKDCYTIIKEMKGGFNARIWQTLATLFSNNLKRNYDPEGVDKRIEHICREIEASGKFVRTNN